MPANFSPDNLLPVIDVTESERGNAVISVSESSGGYIQSVTFDAVIPSWLSVSVSTSSVTLVTEFNESPFPYAVHSVEPDSNVTHTLNDIAQVPCEHRSFNYERLSPGTIYYYFTISAVGKEKNSSGILSSFAASQSYVIEIYANYSIGKNALERLIKCQP